MKNPSHYFLLLFRLNIDLIYAFNVSSVSLSLNGFISWSLVEEAVTRNASSSPIGCYQMEKESNQNFWPPFSSSSFLFFIDRQWSNWNLTNGSSSSATVSFDGPTAPTNRPLSRCWPLFRTSVSLLEFQKKNKQKQTRISSGYWRHWFVN